MVQLLNSAKLGTMEDLEEISQHIAGIPKYHYPEIVEVFFSHFKRPELDLLRVRKMRPTMDAMLHMFRIMMPESVE
jgi:hypothetical protein